MSLRRMKEGVPCLIVRYRDNRGSLGPAHFVDTVVFENSTSKVLQKGGRAWCEGEWEDMIAYCEGKVVIRKGTVLGAG